MTNPVVVGAGPLGLISALALSDSFEKITLVGPPARKDGRTTALMNDSLRFLDDLRIWQRLEGKTAPLKTMRIVDGTQRLIRAPETTFKAEELKLEWFGHNIKNHDLLEVLESAIEENPSITRHSEAVEKAIINNNTPSELHLADGTILNAGLIVAADGRGSLIRESAGITTKTWSYPQVALVVNMSHTRHHENVSTEFHTENGPFTLVPLPGKRSSLVWVNHPDKTKDLIALPNEKLAALIAEKSHYLLGDVTLESAPMTYPLSGLMANTFSRGPVVLIGESAHVFPPIGAQGMNLGIRDIKALVSCVTNHHANGRSNLDALSKAYAKARKVDIPLRTHAVDVLNRSLLSGLLPTQMARGLGLYMLNHIPLLRKFVMKQGLDASIQ